MLGAVFLVIKRYPKPKRSKFIPVVLLIVRLKPDFLFVYVRLYPYFYHIIIRLYPYNMDKKRLQIDQLESKIKIFAPTVKTPVPPTGWFKAIRLALGMSLQQLAKKLSITKQSVLEIEQREKEGNITIKSLREAAKAMDMELVYGFVPKDGSLDALIERKAQELATKIVSRTSNTMKLEDQENTDRRIKKAIVERTAILKQALPKTLWD